MSIQGKAVKRAALPAVFVVATAWWAALTFYEAYRLPQWFMSNIGALTGYSLRTLAMVAYGAIAGMVIALVIAHVRRKDMESALQGESIRNLTTTMGRIPIIAKEPPRAHAMPTFSLYGEPGEKVAAWLKVMTKLSPAHAKLTEALLRVFNSAPMLPATHIPGGHGGKTLIQHSLLVTQVMLDMAPSWSYDGLKNKKGDVVVALRNSAYKFNPNDPILGIIALAHDLGKMECYIKDKSGKVVDSLHAHDTVSGRMIARMPEFWGIPKEDRDAIVLSISHYHHPQDLPMHEDGRALDDRTIAAMELLIKADKAAGKVESGTVYENTMGETEGDDDAPAARLIDDEALYNAFLEIIHEPGRINGKDSSVRVGQKHGGMVYFSESSLRVALIRKLGISSAPVLGDGRSALTVQLMELLSDRGLLMQEFGGKTYSFKRAMFRVAFFNSKNGKHLADWPAVLIVNPGASMPEISSMKDHLSRVEITRPVWGETSATNKSSPAMPSIDLSGEGDAPGAAETPSPGPAVIVDDDDEMDFTASASPSPDKSAQTASGGDLMDDLIGDLIGDDPLSQEAAPTALGPAAETPVQGRDAVAEDDEEVVPVIVDEGDDDVPEKAGPVEAADSVEAFNRVAKKLGGDKPLKGLDKNHLAKLGDKLKDGMDAALADLEKKSSGKPYSRALLLVERAKLVEMREKGTIRLYETQKGDLLALDEIVAARGRFDWDRAVSESESGEHDVFAVVRAGGRVFLKFADFQKMEDTFSDDVSDDERLRVIGDSWQKP